MKNYKKSKPVAFALSFLLIVCFFLLLLSCAKKMLPPSPDRFAPHLEQIKPINRIRIDLTFDEELNSNINAQNLLITSSNNDTIRIRNIAIRKNKISLYTEPVKSGVYRIAGLIPDKFNNFARINTKFQASSFIDTIAPKIVSVFPDVGSLKKITNIYLEFGFNKPIDTSSLIKFYSTSLDTNKMKFMWQSDWQKLTIGYADSLPPHTYVYFTLVPTVKDLEGNTIKDFGYTFFTSDSILPPLLITGNLSYQDRPYQNSIILFTSSNQKAFSISDAKGDFSIRLDSLKYNITALADTNYDNCVDLIAELNNFYATDTIKIKLELKPILEKTTIDKYLY